MNRKLLLPLVLVVAMIAIMQLQGATLAARARGGILALEFAWYPFRFDMLADLMGRGAVLANIWLDFLFIAVYCWFLVRASLALRGRFRTPRPPLFFARLAVLAGIFDIVENVCLLGRIYGWLGTLAPPVAAVCAALKFLCVVWVLFFLLYAWLMRRPSPAPSL